MAEAGVNSQLNRELDSQLQSRLVDSQTAKKAIAKSARLLRGLLTNHEERIDALVQHGLLEHKDTKDVVKGLQEKIGQRPSLLWVLISQIKSMIPEGEEAARRLQHWGENPSETSTLNVVLLIKLTLCIIITFL